MMYLTTKKGFSYVDSLSTQPSTDKAMNLNLAYSGLLQSHLTCYSMGGSPGELSEELVA